MATTKKPVSSKKAEQKKSSTKKTAQPVKAKSVASKKTVLKKKPVLPSKKVVKKIVAKTLPSTVKKPIKPVISKSSKAVKPVSKSIKLPLNNHVKKKIEKGKKIMNEKSSMKSKEKEVAVKTGKSESSFELESVKIPDIFKGDDATDASNYSFEKKLIALFSLQQIDSQIDKIQIVRGELPLEVQDMEDSVIGLETRVENNQQEIVNLEKDIQNKQIAIKDAQALLKKYKDQKNNVKNNREFDSLTKEIEYQTLVVQVAEKNINEYLLTLEDKKEAIKKSNAELKEMKNDLAIKKDELKEITSETENEEVELQKKSEQNQKYIEERLLGAYKRIRSNARNGLAVVKIERDACGGCFNKIPPQRQLEIQMHKNIIVCEYCGRILVDDEIANAVK